MDPRVSPLGFVATSPLLLLLTAAPNAQEPAALSTHPTAAVEHLITAETIDAVIRFLADDLLEGRGVATRGDHLTRRYLATQFQLFGMQPAGTGTGSTGDRSTGDRGTGASAGDPWEQPVPMLGITATVKEPLRVTGKLGDLEFTAPRDYTAEAGHAKATSQWRDAEIVFVGYGIHAPEQQWDDFKDVDVKGKVLLVMNNDPADDPDLFAGPVRLYYGRWSYKFEEAARRGAVGCIVIHTEPSASYPFQVIQATHGQEDFWLPFQPGVPTMPIQAWCSEDAARNITALGGHELDDLRAAAEKRDFVPVPLNVKANLGLENAIREITSANVLGKLEGSDPELKDEVVVVTGHFDHLGIRAPKNGDEIYNGALDNASGCAALLALARACGALDPAPKRTILFAAVTAEESGLLGSLYYARNPTFPREKIVANYNIDTINIWGETTDIAMVGHGKNTLTALAAAVAERRGRELIPNPDVAQGFFYRSDHFSFARVGIPSAYFKAGKAFLENRKGKNLVMGAYTRTRYHQPNDEYLTGWDLRGAAADTRLILECLVRTANAAQAPRWAAGDEFEKLR